jgi:transposase InsO family protein
MQDVSLNRKKVKLELLNKISAIFKEHDGVLGSPKMRRELAKIGVFVGKNRVAQLMRELGLRSKTHKRYRVATTDSKHSLPVAANLLQQNFVVDAPNKVLVSDITYVKTLAGWAYLVVFIDLYSRMVVGWAVSSSLSTDMLLTALNQAIRRRRLQPGVIIHSDRGCQYASDAFRELLQKNGFVQSMSRKGNCYDNAVAESFFRIYKYEMANHCTFRDCEELRNKSFWYLESYYNRKRMHGTIGYLTPMECEILSYREVY